MITLEQARKMLPPGCNLSDTELSSILADLYLIANLAVSDFLNHKCGERKSDGVA